MPEFIVNARETRRCSYVIVAETDDAARERYMRMEEDFDDLGSELVDWQITSVREVKP